MSWPAMVAALAVPLLCALVYVVWIPHGNGGRSAWFATKIWVLGYPLFFFSLIGLGGLVRREDRAAKWPSWRMVILTGLLSGTGIALVGWLMVLTPVGDIVKDNSHNLVEKARDLGFATRGRFLMVATFITLLHSAMEEYYWRWFVFKRFLRHRSLGQAIAISSIGFMAHHVIVLGMFFGFENWMTYVFSIGVAIGGAAWAWLYSRSGNLYSAWISHAFVDAAIFWVGYDILFQ